jgi:hypothetical protein
MTRVGYVRASLGIAGAASVAHANDKDDYPSAFRIGLLGQVFGPVRGRALGFTYAPSWHRHYLPAQYRMWSYEY